jgi:hypothetical protein
MAWEAEHLFKSVSPQKVVLVMPPRVSSSDNEKRWQLLRELTHDRLPPYRSGTVALYFPMPDRLIRISLDSGNELSGIPREQLVAAYEEAILMARDYSEEVTAMKAGVANKDSVQLMVEKLSWRANHEGLELVPVDARS